MSVPALIHSRDSELRSDLDAASKVGIDSVPESCNKRWNRQERKGRQQERKGQRTLRCVCLSSLFLGVLGALSGSFFQLHGVVIRNQLLCRFASGSVRSG